MEIRETLTTHFKKYLEDKVFIEVLDLVKQNSEGNIWIMGGFIYRNLASDLYGNDQSTYIDDIDFLVEKRNDLLIDVPGWEKYTNSYGTENYLNEKTRTIFTELGKAIRMNQYTTHTVEAFLEGTPLTIQSIAYDLSSHTLIGEKGIQALLEKEIKINDSKQAEFYAQRKGKTIDQIMEEKTRELNF